MQFIHKMLTHEIPSFAITSKAMELLRMAQRPNMPPSVVMWRRKQAEDAATFYVWYQGEDMALVPFITNGIGIIDLIPTAKRREGGIYYAYHDEGNQAADDAIVLANQLFNSGVIDGYMGFVNKTVELDDEYGMSTIDRTQLLDGWDPEPYFDKESKYGLYFQDSLTDAFYPVEEAKIWAGAVLDSAFYFAENVEYRLSELAQRHPELHREIGIDVRKAIRRIEANNQ